MSSNESVEFFMRFVNERYKEVVSSTLELIKVMPSENRDAKKQKANVVFKNSQDLLSALPENDKPQWLKLLSQHAQHFANDATQPHVIMEFLVDNSSLIRGHEWAFESQVDTFDFDSIFEHYKSESRLPELFEEIIRLLELIQGSGDVDSVAMMNALGKVIATLKNSKNGSYFSLNGAWSFLMSFLQNYMWTELSKLPVLGSAMEALRKTIEETNEEMYKVHAQVQKEVQTSVELQVKGLNKTNFNFISYDKSGKNLDISEQPKRISAAV